MSAPCSTTARASACGCVAPHAGVDVDAVGLGADGHHFRAELVEHRRRDVVARAVRAVDDDLPALEVEVGGKGALAELDVPARRVLDATRLAEFGGRHAGERHRHRRLDRVLGRVGKLGAGPGKELDAVVVVGIVRRADDDAGVEPQRPGEVGDARRGQRPAQQDIDAGRRQARLQRRLEQVAGDPRVLADEHGGMSAGAARVRGQDATRRPAELEHELRRDRRLADQTPHAVGAEIVPLRHRSPRVVMPSRYRCPPPTRP